MNLQTTLTNISKVELRKTRLWKSRYKVGESLLMVLVILALLAFLFSYVLLSFISPAG
jgi:preprotein translocase subunit SecE